MAFQGSLKELPLPDIIQLVSVSGKTGMFALRKAAGETGQIYLRNGQIVHAKASDLEGEEAVYELAIWREGDFVFTPGKDAEAVTIQKSNTNLLMEAARRIDEWQVLSKRIPSTRLVPVFTSQGASTSVSLTPQEWAVICKIDERRSIEEIAIGLGTSPFETCKLLYGLITSGLVTLKEDLSRLKTERVQRLSVSELAQVASQVHQLARQLLSSSDRLHELDAMARLSHAEMEAGRGSDAIVDLVRADEKIVSAVLGPNQSKQFLERVSRILAEG
jgi:hypothetical protein